MSNQTKVHDALLEAFSELNEAINLIDGLLSENGVSSEIKNQLKRNGLDVFSVEKREGRFSLIAASSEAIQKARLES